MSKVLLIEPYDFLSSEYKDDHRYAIYEDKSVRYWSSGLLQTKNIDYPCTVPLDIDLDAIRAKISWTTPLWSRWLGQADRYEDYRQSCLLFVIRLADVLSELEVESVIFPTGVAHHIEYSLIEAASQVAGSQQVYLYPVPFFNAPSRLVPLVQNRSISDRRILAAAVSDKESHDVIVEYRDNHLAAKPPQQNEKIDHLATSYPYALTRVAFLWLKDVAKVVLGKRVHNGEHFLDKLKDYDCLSKLRIVQQQKLALDYYSSVMLNDAAVDLMLEGEKPLPILYAHYQPEASTFPEGGDFANHLDVVLAMRRIGYRGTILYKEHPGSWIYYSGIVGFSRVGVCRSVEYYRQLEALGCIFVSPNYRLRDSRLKHLFPVTITGSIGVERSLTGLATCCAGLPWFQGAPGVFNVQETFGACGIFFEPERWQFDPMKGLAWFDEALSGKTIINFPGIGTGIPLTSVDDKTAFLAEFEDMVQEFVKEGLR
jgi:hypothetical protein